MTTPPAKRIRRQKLGLRPGLEPYYAIAEQTPTRLVLQSRPGANALAGQAFLGCGGAILVLGVLIVFSSFFTSTRLAGDAICSGLLGWPFVFVALALLTGGRAISTTSNTITIDAETATVVYTQANRATRRRSQTLVFDQVARLRLRERTYTPPGLLRQPRPIVALELITDENFTWLIDSAANAAALQPLATAVAAVLQTPPVEGVPANPVAASRQAAGPELPAVE